MKRAAPGTTPDPLRPADLARRLASAGIEIGAAEAAQLAAYLTLLEQWNRVHNLTGIRDRSELIDRHLVESLALVPHVKGPRVADLGSGAGLPGLPLAVCLPDVEFTLIESRRKRVSFLRQAAAALALTNLEIAHGRAESLQLPAFDSVLARAVAPPRALLALVEPLLEPGGRLVLLAGEAKTAELVALADAYRELAPSAASPQLKSRLVVLERALSPS